MEDQHEQEPATPARVRVIIVNYNGAAHLGRCVAALRDQTIDDFEVVIADNGSTDGSLATLPALGDRFHILELGANLGFAAANNRAAKGTQARWIATLNPDAFAEPGWLETLLAAAERYPDVAMFGSTQISDADPGRFDGTGDAYYFAGFPWRGNHGRAVATLPDFAETFSPCAAAAMWRRHEFESVGGFDERFFCYCEDVDLGFRLRLTGERCVQVAAARVRHVGAASSGDRSAFALYHGARNRVWTMVKNLPLPLLVVALPAHVGGILYMVAKAMGRAAGWDEVKATLRGLGAALEGLGPVIAARRRRISPAPVGWRIIARTMTWSPGRYLAKAADLRHIEPR